MQQEQVMEGFRFKSRVEYERAIEQVLLAGKSGKKKKKEDPEKAYEELLEEYLNFCSSQEDGI